MLGDEKTLEDWVVQHVPEVVGDPDARLVGRQIPVPDGGRLDVLAAKPGKYWHSPFTFFVIEIKAKRAKAEAVVQLLRYVGNLRQVVGPQRQHGAPVRGILAAPTLSRNAGILLTAADLKFCHLAVSVTAEVWDGCDAGFTEEERLGLDTRLDRAHADMHPPKPQEKDRWEAAQAWLEDEDYTLSARGESLIVHLRNNAPDLAGMVVHYGGKYRREIIELLRMHYPGSTTRHLLPRNGKGGQLEREAEPTG